MYKIIENTLSSVVQKLWFSLYDFTFTYQGDEQPFANPADFTWSEDFEKHWQGIKSELLNYLENHQAKTYFREDMATQPNAYQTFSLRWWDIEFPKNQRHFPLTTSLLKKFPEITTLSFNFLKPGATILPHCGDTNAIWRCHFGIDVPGKLPECGFRVLEEKRSWENGKWLIFLDAYQHEAFNHTNKLRMIMLMDVIRPAFAKKRKRVVSTVMTSLFLQKRAARNKWLAKMPHWFVRLLAFFLRPMAWMAIWTVNKLRVY
jgi:aspartyl/asparaginyl beta-hydroxylase (cupin superfamily)